MLTISSDYCNYREFIMRIFDHDIKFTTRNQHICKRCNQLIKIDITCEKDMSLVYLVPNHPMSQKFSKICKNCLTDEESIEYETVNNDFISFIKGVSF